MSSLQSDSLIHIATIGKSVGFRGDLKLHLFTDFSEQFKKNSSFFVSKDLSLTIERIDLARSLVKFIGYDSELEAKKLTNKDLFTTLERTRSECKLADGEHFWFDLIGCKVLEDGEVLGEVVEVERINATNYLHIKTDEALLKDKTAKLFLIPKITPFVVGVDLDAKTITVSGAKDILEAS